ERKRQRLTVEVPVRHEQLVVEQDKWVVGRRIELDGDRVADVVEQVPRCTVHLWRAAQRVRILDLVAPAMRLDDRRVVEQPEHVRRRVDLAGQGSGRVNLWQEAGP